MKKKVESNNALKCIAKCLVLAVMTITLFLSGCAPFAERPEAEITVTLPPIGGESIRAIAESEVARLQAATASYRVRANQFTRTGKETSYKFFFAAGTKVDVTVECINSQGQVIVRTGTKSHVVTRGGDNSILFKLREDGTEIVVSEPPASGDGGNGQKPDDEEKPEPEPTPPSSGPNIWMSDHEVTQKEWKDVMGNDGNGATTPQNSSMDYGKGDNYPMYYVSWYDALVYCNKLSIKENRTPCYTINGKTNPDDWGTVPGAQDNGWDAAICDFNANGYRLPTEAEWEYMAKGGENHTYSGSDNIDDVAWYTTNSSGKTHEVKGKKPNKYGMYDMSGNVYEWCWDWYTSGSLRVDRGGGWLGSVANCGVSHRYSSTPFNRVSHIGFRVVRSTTPTPETSPESTTTPTEQTYTLTLNLNGGSWANASDEITQYSASDLPLTLPTPNVPAALNGYVFAGWIDKDNNYGLVGTDGLAIPSGTTGDKTYYAVYHTISAGTAASTTSSATGSIEFVAVQGGTVPLAEDYMPVVSNFSMGKTEITQAQWQAVMGSLPDSSKMATADGDSNRNPVNYVSWYDAIAFCNKLSILENKTPCYSVSTVSDWSALTYAQIPTSKNTDWDNATCDFDQNGYRLPTEAEREYAARGGIHHSAFKYSGSDTVDDVAWYKDNSNSATHEVGTTPIKENALGISDMSGNVMEWCWDWYSGYASANTNGGSIKMQDPTGYPSGYNHVLRGGAWEQSATVCSVKYRFNFHGPSERNNRVGFRIVCRQ